MKHREAKRSVDKNRGLEGFNIRVSTDQQKDTRTTVIHSSVLFDMQRAIPRFR